MATRDPALAIVAALSSLPPRSPPSNPSPGSRFPFRTLHDFQPQQPKRIELKNGIVIFLQEDHELPFISGSVLIPGGSRDEDPAKAGLVGLYGQAWRTSGTAKMDGDAMDDLLEAKAAHIETGGDDDSTALSWDSLKGDCGPGLLAGHGPAFSSQIQRGKARSWPSSRKPPASCAATTTKTRSPSAKSAKLVYGVNSPYTRQPELATIGAVTVADLQAWHDRTLKGKLIVGISGDFDPAAMEAKVRAAFERLPPVTPDAAAPRCSFPAPSPASTSSTRKT